MAKPTHEDAMIMLQLAQWGAAINLSDASNWMWSDEFVPDAEGFRAKYPIGSEGARELLTIGTYYETIFKPESQPIRHSAAQETC